MVAVGSSIGSGIFRAPGEIVAQLHQPWYVIGIWVLGGIIALCGALTYAEMGSMYPGAGGLYVYLRAAYGDLAGFLYGWFILFVSTSGAIAALATVCSEHLLYLFGERPEGALRVPLAMAIIVFLTVVNSFGVQWSSRMATVFTLAKLAGLVLIMAAGWLWFRPEVWAENFTGAYAHTPPASPWQAFSTAMVGILFSYGGWQHASFLSAETHEPQRTVPRAMIIGAVIVTTVYVLTNLAYMRLLPLQHIANTSTIAADALQTRWAWAGPLMAFLIALSTFGTTGIYCSTSPRMYYAMARDGVFFEVLARIHPRWRTPVHAMALQSGWSLILVMVWGTFGGLIGYATFIDWVGLALVGTAIFVLRKRQPAAQRLFKVPFYPIPPLIFIGVTVAFILLQLFNDPVRSGAGLAVVGIGWIVYELYFKRLKQQKKTSGEAL
jgi:basic amino acid/polyamine antiporter, APA family